MQAAQVTAWSEAPRYVTVPKLPAPQDDSEVQLRVLAAGAHQVVRSRAAGRHYSAKTLPHVPGVDGVGCHESNGSLYYFMNVSDHFGTFAQYVNVPRSTLVALPAGTDPVAFAASVNPAMSSWMAITQRTDNLPTDWTALVVGATSASGRLAVHSAKALGAARVVGVARDEAALKAVEALDDYIVLQDNMTATDFSGVEPDVILDYVYGDLAHHLLTSLQTKKAVQYVQIGTLSGKAEMSLPGPLLRSTNLTIRGAGPGSWRLTALFSELQKLVPLAAKWPAPATTQIPLSDIEKSWDDKSIKGRVVFVP